jgi:hypothetical protein
LTKKELLWFFGEEKKDKEEKGYRGSKNISKMKTKGEREKSEGGRGACVCVCV